MNLSFMCVCVIFFVFFFFFFLSFLGRPCVDCHAFEFMQRALQDLKKTAFSLDARVGEQKQRPCITAIKR